MRRTALIGGIVLALGLGILGLLTLIPAGGPSVPEGLSEIKDPAVMKEVVELSHLGIRTSTNYLGHRIYSIHGKLKNISDKPLRLIEVKMTFVDYDRKAVQESVHQAFEPKWKPLEPGTEFQFSVAFENLPRTWNYRVPLTEISKIAF
jgi:hypothetical protein